MSTDDRNFWTSLGWHLIVAGFVIYLGVTGGIPVTDALLAVAAIAGLALPSTVMKPPSV